MTFEACVFESHVLLPSPREWYPLKCHGSDRNPSLRIAVSFVAAKYSVKIGITFISTLHAKRYSQDLYCNFFCLLFLSIIYRNNCQFLINYCILLLMKYSNLTMTL